MRGMQYRWLVVLAAGCATAGNGEPQQQQPDAATADAPPPDAPPPPPCMATAMTQLLANPAFDATPSGMGWTQAPIDPTYPIVTTDDGIAEQTPAQKAWMGGFAQANAIDRLHQDVTIPMGTASLVVKGYYAVGTTEPGTAAVKDTATVVLLDGATVVDTVIALDNKQPAAMWTAIDHPVPNAAALSGKTIRLRFESSNDATAHTNFFFDSFSLTATHCP
jgi:hypothetical protein